MMRFAFLFSLLLSAAGATAQTPNSIYAEQCRKEVGELPVFSCDSGVPVPVTVNGVPITDHAPATCDRPALLSNGKGSDGQCVPFSRVLDLSTDKMQVAVMCRQKHFRSAASNEYDEIDVIAHNPATGATCWFQAKAEPGKTKSGKDVPSPTQAINDDFWALPSEIVADGCGDCHDNDPFMYSPFIGQVWEEVPVNPLGPYFHVAPELGFAAWPTETFQPRDNTCVGCHRIGRGKWDGDYNQGTCGSLTNWMTDLETPEGADEAAMSWPLSHAMPPGYGHSQEIWENVYAEAVSEISYCCSNPEAQECRLTPIATYPKEQ